MSDVSCKHGMAWPHRFNDNGYTYTQCPGPEPKQLCLMCEAGVKHGWCDDGVTFNGEVQDAPKQISADHRPPSLPRVDPSLTIPDPHPPGIDPSFYRGDGPPQIPSRRGPEDPEPTPLEILDRARELVYGEREKDYGHPADDYKRTAALWSALLGTEITPGQAALCMVLVKLSREMNAPKPDNLVDAHGYLLVAGRIKERELGRE